MEACGHQNRWKIDAKCEWRFFEKSCSPCSGDLIFWVRGIQVGSKNRPKIYLKAKSRWEVNLASILMDFGKQAGKENRAKRHQKWHRKNDEKKKGNKMAKKSQFEILTPRGPLGPDPRGEGEGLKEEGL